MHAPHQYVPLLPSERDEMRAQERNAAAMDGAVCMALAEDIVGHCDRYDSRWHVEDAEKITRLRALLTEAQAIAMGLRP